MQTTKGDVNTQVVKDFFTAFKNKDADKMNSCYSRDITFFDPMFGLLREEEARAMWRMLCGNAKDFSLTFDEVNDEGDNYYTCNWTASYLFSKTGKRVENHCRAHMKVEDGIITEHSDSWSLHKWLGQALGMPGKLFGWAGLLRRKVKNDARRSLLKFMENEKRV